VDVIYNVLIHARVDAVIIVEQLVLKLVEVFVLKVVILAVLHHVPITVKQNA
jgi:hypothetical protein